MSVKIVPATKEGENEDGIVSRFINPGEFYFGESNCQLHTILGSCIAITLWHPVLHIGGMCHFVLPENTEADKKTTIGRRPDGRYLDGAMKLFEMEVKRRGTNLQEYHAKIFGGGNMIPNSVLREDELIGTRNAEAAMKYLLERGISVLVAHVGETGYRRIVYEVGTGDVWVKHEPQNVPAPLLRAR